MLMISEKMLQVLRNSQQLIERMRPQLAIQPEQELRIGTNDLEGIIHNHGELSFHDALNRIIDIDRRKRVFL